MTALLYIALSIIAFSSAGVRIYTLVKEINKLMAEEKRWGHG